MEPESSREAFSGRLISVVVEQWPPGEREVVRHPGACAVVALVGDTVVLVRQMREAVRERLLEIPAGILDVAGEDEATCASRELVEETGHLVLSLEPLGEILTSPGFADERIALFLAEAQEPAGGGQAGEVGVEVVRMPFPEALQAVQDGLIKDAKSVVGLLLARTRREGSSSTRKG